MAEHDSEHPRESGFADPAETLGNILRRARTSKHISLEEAAEATRIHATTLAALEQDNRGALPAEVFTRGFVKIYARFLDLDPEEALQLYIRQYGDKRDEGVQKINVQEILSTESLAESPVTLKGRHIFLMLFTVVLIFLGYWGYNVYRSGMAPPSQTHPAANSGPVLPGGVKTGPNTSAEPAASPDGEPATVAEDSSLSRESVPDETINETVAEPSLVSPSAGNQDGTGSQADLEREMEKPFPQSAPDERREEGADGPASQEIDSGTTNNEDQAATPQPATSATDEDVPVPYILEARFVEDTWMRVKVDGNKPREYFFHPGDRHVWKAKQGIELFIGNAGGLSLSLNDTPMPPLGPSGKTARISIPPATERP